MSGFGVDGVKNNSNEEDETPEGTVDEASLPAMLDRLKAVTGVNFSKHEQQYEAFVRTAHSEVGSTAFSDRLADLRAQLVAERAVGKIRGVEAWADGTDSFRFLWKSWGSFVDKLYRLNIEENDRPPTAPPVLTIQERADKAREASNRNWITPENAHSFVDDIIRTKFVVPFADGVMDVSETVRGAAEELGLRCYRRYHAKDSGYHAHHIYVLLPVPGLHGTEAEVAVEVKVLTKLQDTLGELTHLLYEHKRTGRLPSQKKRKLAWIFDSPDFTSSYVGHTAHYIEASLVRLKRELAGMEGIDSGKP